MKKRLESFTFFVDRDLGPRFFRSLVSDVRFNVEFHDEHFKDPSTDDSIWLRFIADRGWVGVTHDKRIRRDHGTIIRAHGARVIVVVGQHPLAAQAKNFRDTYAKIERFVRNTRPPFVAKLYQPSGRDRAKLKPKGRIESWLDL